jgi:putative PIN family toxin of toxin-antitoxin system
VSSVPAQAVDKALRTSVVLKSLETWQELEEVLLRPKFERYRASQFRQDYLQFLIEALELVSVMTEVSVCRHAKDNKFLALALDGQADAIITGDADLLVLHPFQDVSILSPAAYLAL